MFGPVFTVVGFLILLTVLTWIVASALSILTIPLRFFVGIKMPILRRFIIRLISYTAQGYINRLNS
jgi:hypothetical protein